MEYKYSTHALWHVPMGTIFLKISWVSTKANIIKNENNPKSKPSPKARYPKVNFWSNDNSLMSQGHSLRQSPPREVNEFCRTAVFLWNSKSCRLKVNLIFHQYKHQVYIEKPRQNHNTEAVNGTTHFPKEKHSSLSVLKSKNTWGCAFICDHGRVFFIFLNPFIEVWGLTHI